MKKEHQMIETGQFFFKLLEVLSEAFLVYNFCAKLVTLNITNASLKQHIQY